MKQVLLLQACARRWLAKRRVDALRKEKNDPIRLHSRIQDLVQQLKTRPDSQDVEVPKILFIVFCYLTEYCEGPSTTCGRARIAIR